MAITIQLPTVLAREAGTSAATVNGANVAAALDALDALHPGLADRIRTEAGEPRRHILIYLNDTEVREMEGLRTALKDGDTLFIVAAVSGG
jgi:molybdopterin converting factor small subunit